MASIFSARERYHGYVDAMRGGTASGRGRTGRCTVSTRRAAAKAVRDLFADGVEPRPSALFSAQNFVTIGAVQALHELGLHRDRRLVGFDDVDMADVVEPGLSVVPQRPLRARPARRRAAPRPDRRPPWAGRRAILANELIVRGSGEIPPRTTVTGRPPAA